jgi:carbon storage regulator
MLVLSRRVGERILIGENITVTVVRIQPGSVRIGIDAPDDVEIMREEIASQEIQGPVAARPEPRGAAAPR